MAAGSFRMPRKGRSHASMTSVQAAPVDLYDKQPSAVEITTPVRDALPWPTPEGAQARDSSRSMTPIDQLRQQRTATRSLIPRVARADGLRGAAKL